MSFLIKKTFVQLCLLFIFTINTYSQLKAVIKAENWIKVDRGEVIWKDNSVVIQDCILQHKDSLNQPFELSFEARALKGEKQVQIWAGVGMLDRDNRYMLGLRGGNNNDLFLRRRKTVGKDKLLALEPLEFEPKTGNWYKIRIVSWDGNIHVYLADEDAPRIIELENQLTRGGSIYLGGGWIKTEYRNIKITKLDKNFLIELKHQTKKVEFAKTVSKKEVQRKAERQSYKPLTINKINSSRTEIDLSGNWLFIPEPELDSKEPWLSSINDNNWHVIPVPEFWNPVSNWMYGWEKGLDAHPSGVSDNYNEKELKRCNDYTFDWQNTQAAWYRHWIELPNALTGKVLKLHFDAVSKVAQVYVNGHYAGEHIGMFGDFEVDITNLVHPGKNVIAVNVKVRKSEVSANAHETVARAVTVDITNDMLNSLPHGMFHGTEGGIWQPVRLVITEPIYIDDIFANVKSNGGIFEITLQNESDTAVNTEVSIEIHDDEENLFFKLDKLEYLNLEPGKSGKVFCKTDEMNPRLWSPEYPNLYNVTVRTNQNGKEVDTKNLTFGFRTIEVKGDKFYLNGKPYFMQGANHLPSGIAANDKALANRLLKLMHDGNQMVTRTHGSVFTKAWMEAADHQGVGVSFEGTWPWLMINSIPSPELLEIWKKETISLVRKYRNHPSLLMWTMNNEMYFTMFYHNDPKDVRLKKWKYISDIIKAVRRLIPGLPISADSGYNRLKADYEVNLKPYGIDDGDVDDRHIYFCWYNRDFFQIINGEWTNRIYWTPGANQDRPFFPQEVSTGYPNNDEGHFTRKYIEKHQVPQAFIGDWAWEDRDPAYGLNRHAFMNKELAEVIRRTAPGTSGFLLFANTCWFRNVWDSKTIEPYPVYNAVKTALQPVLVSAELFGRHFWAGTTIEPLISVVHHDNNRGKLDNLELTWKIIKKEKVLNQGKIPFESTEYYTSSSQKVKITIPDDLPAAKTECNLELFLSSDGKQISENSYDILLCDEQWINDIDKLSGKKIALFDITGETCEIFDSFQIPYFELNDLTEIRTKNIDILVVANLDNDNEVPYNWEDVRRMAGNGLNTLLIHPGKHLKWLYYYEVESIYERHGRITNMKLPEHEIFNDLETSELAWWQQDGRKRPRACRRSYRFRTNKNISMLVEYLRPHVYLSDPTYQLYEMTGYPLVEFKEKSGTIIASELELNQALKDPVAGKMLINILLYLCKI